MNGRIYNMHQSNGSLTIRHEECLYRSIECQLTNGIDRYELARCAIFDSAFYHDANIIKTVCRKIVSDTRFNMVTSLCDDIKCETSMVRASTILNIDVHVLEVSNVLDSKNFIYNIMFDDATFTYLESLQLIEL